MKKLMMSIYDTICTQFVFVWASILGVGIALLLSVSGNMVLVYVSILSLFVVSLVPILWEFSIKKFDFMNSKNLFVLYYLFQLGIPLIYTLLTGKTFIPWLRLDNSKTQIFYAMAI